MRGSITLAAHVWQFFGEYEFEDRAAVFDARRLPKFTRVCEKIESGSISFAETLERLAAIRDPLPRQRLFRFQIADALFVRLHNRIAFRFDDAIQKLFDFALDGADVLFERDALRARRNHLRFPLIAEHLEGEMEQALRRAQIVQQDFKLALNHLSAHRLAARGAAARVAEIVRVLRASAFRPAGGHGLTAIAARHEPTQRKILVDVFACGNLGSTGAAILHGLPGGKADKRLVLGWHQMEAPIFDGDMTGIHRTGENLGDALDMDFAIAVARIGGLRFQKPPHFRKGLQPPRRITFERFGNDGSQRLIAHQQLAVSSDALVSVALRRMKYPIAVCGPRAHPVLCLHSVLLTLMLRDGSHEVFMQDAIGIVAKFDGRAFELATRFAKQIAQIPMAAHISREAVDIVDDDDALFVAVLLEELEHGGHARA